MTAMPRVSLHPPQTLFRSKTATAVDLRITLR